MKKGFIAASLLAFVLSFGVAPVMAAEGEKADCSKIEDAAKKAECEKGAKK